MRTIKLWKHAVVIATIGLLIVSCGGGGNTASNPSNPGSTPPQQPGTAAFDPTGTWAFTFVDAASVETKAVHTKNSALKPSTVYPSQLLSSLSQMPQLTIKYSAAGNSVVISGGRVGAAERSVQLDGNKSGSTYGYVYSTSAVDPHCNYVKSYVEKLAFTGPNFDGLSYGLDVVYQFIWDRGGTVSPITGYTPCGVYLKNTFYDLEQGDDFWRVIIASGAFLDASGDIPYLTSATLHNSYSGGKVN